MDNLRSLTISIASDGLAARLERSGDHVRITWLPAEREPVWLSPDQAAKLESAKATLLSAGRWAA